MPEPRLTERRKREVFDNASSICEYCRSQQECSPDPFSVEHIMPRARGGLNDFNNLALSCQGCNGHKATKLEASDPMSSEFMPLFHPRQQQWHEHFQWNDDFTLIIGLTGVGRATVETLQLNRPGVINLRRVLYTTGLHPPEERKQ